MSARNQRQTPANERQDTRLEREDTRRKRDETSVRCPICGKPVSAEHRPFCSRRCRDIDLGRWLKGSYAFPGEPAGKDPNDGDRDD